MNIPHVVDEDMHRLRRRIGLLSRKEKQSTRLSQHFIMLALRTGLPMVDVDSGEPTAAAWVFLSLSAAFPLYAMCLLAQCFHPTSSSLSSVL